MSAGATADAVPGDAYEMRELRRQINEGGDAAALVQACDNMHSVAGMLKMFFRELAEPVLTFALYDECIRCSAAMGGPSESTDTADLSALLARLPPGYAPLQPLRTTLGPPSVRLSRRAPTCPSRAWAGTSRCCAASCSSSDRCHGTHQVARCLSPALLPPASLDCAVPM